MSKKSPVKVSSEDQEPVLPLSPEEIKLARMMMFTFGYLTGVVLLLAATLFYSSLTVWSATIPSVLWSFCGIGTISALCTATLHHWIKSASRANQ